ncbi:hypothetical protein UFOVP265_47 [uncultured Caudovirales phage]|uniref:Uncharacterized protein n=1 Tax=uncultured Caudovirales phage TaxID=2100421 RepID=A0A6J5LLT1_9CAUD|nr:hypothetical protein UFOVP265_47 [uncultured Caudovirales phage]
MIYSYYGNYDEKIQPKNSVVNFMIDEYLKNEVQKLTLLVSKEIGRNLEKEIEGEVKQLKVLNNNFRELLKVLKNKDKEQIEMEEVRKKVEKTLNKQRMEK